MKAILVLAILTSLSNSALSQEGTRFDVVFGIGKDLVYPSVPFKNDFNLSGSMYYRASNDWGIGISIGREVYELTELNSRHTWYPAQETPDIKRMVTSLLVGARYVISTESKIANPYVLVALGPASSTSSADGYDVFRYPEGDTVYRHIDTGQFLMGLLSLGIQIRPSSVLVFIVELEAPTEIYPDRHLSAIACRIGIGVMF